MKPCWELVSAIIGTLLFRRHMFPAQKVGLKPLTTNAACCMALLMLVTTELISAARRSAE
jgi:hypothetical protein